jgi:hypothetical protein
MVVLSKYPFGMVDVKPEEIKNQTPGKNNQVGLWLSHIALAQRLAL